MSNDGRIRPDGKRQEFLSLTLLSEGQFMIEGMPRSIWAGLMTGLGVGARRAQGAALVQALHGGSQEGPRLLLAARSTRPWYWPV
jgi:hypothetical protein